MTLVTGFDTQAITAHICRRITEAQVIREPWPHLLVQEFFRTRCSHSCLRRFRRTGCVLTRAIHEPGWRLWEME